MQSTTTKPNSHRQMLMYCRVTNSNGETTERFVDMATFSLWQYYMQNRHGFSVTGVFPCIWLPQQQSQQHERLFEHAGFTHSVSKLTLESFDENLGINQSQTRFIATKELATVSARLEHHWLQSRDALVTTSEAGSAISTTPASYGVTSNSVAASHAA